MSNNILPEVAMFSLRSNFIAFATGLSAALLTNQAFAQNIDIIVPIPQCNGITYNNKIICDPKTKELKAEFELCVQRKMYHTNLNTKTGEITKTLKVETFQEDILLNLKSVQNDIQETQSKGTSFTSTPAHDLENLKIAQSHLKHAENLGLCDPKAF